MISPASQDSEEQPDVTPPHADDYIAPAPRVSVQAFCTSDATATAARGASEDRRLAKAHLSVHMGGIAAAVTAFEQHLNGWINALTARQPIRAFHDMTMAPVPTELVTAGITALLHDRARGIFQLTGSRDATYADVGRFIAHRVGADPTLVTTISASDAGLPEGATPRHTTLDSSALRDRYGLSTPDTWDVIEGVAAVNRSLRQ